MESLFEALYTYALDNQLNTYSLRDQEERHEAEIMIQVAIEELKTRGMGDATQRRRLFYSSFSEPASRFLGRADHWPGAAPAVVLRLLRQLQQLGGNLLQPHAPGGLYQNGAVRADHLGEDGLRLLPVSAVDHLGDHAGALERIV